MGRSEAKSAEDGYRMAIRWLSARSLTAEEVRRRLEEAGVREASLVVSRLEQQHWLDDTAVARQELRRAEIQGYGFTRFRLRLWERGVAEPVRDEWLACWDGDAEIARVETACRRAGRLQDPNERARLVRRLMRQGYAQSLIIRALEASRGNRAGSEGAQRSDDDGPEDY